MFAALVSASTEVSLASRSSTTKSINTSSASNESSLVGPAAAFNRAAGSIHPAPANATHSAEGMSRFGEFAPTAMATALSSHGRIAPISAQIRRRP